MKKYIHDEMLLLRALTVQTERRDDKEFSREEKIKESNENLEAISERTMPTGYKSLSRRVGEKE